MTPTKYPRTPHLPWSPGGTSDDIRCVDARTLIAGHELVITEKMDGECTTMYRDHIHARSVDGAHHPSRSWVKRLWSEIRMDIPAGWRVCGENLYARHSLAYTQLPSYFLGFSVWDDQNTCLNWDDTMEWFALLGVIPVPTIWRGIGSMARVQSLSIDTSVREGYVVRRAGSFAYADFASNVAKWVRRSHVQTDAHWMDKPIVPNGMAVDVMRSCGMTD